MAGLGNAGPALTAVAVLLAGCAAGPEYHAEPLDELAANAEVRQSGKPEETGSEGSAGTAPSGQGGTGTAPATTRQTKPAGQGADTPDSSGIDEPSGSPTSSPPAPGWRRIGSLTDGRGDQGLTGGPSYADLTGVTVDDNGRSARFTVSVAGDLPTRLPSGEVEGIGVDVYRTSGRESEYQIFLDCGDGWRAFLQTPKGFVAFPGRLELSDRTLVVEVPWSALGGRSDFDLTAFADWSKEGSLVNESSSDFAPAMGRTSVRP